MDEYWFEADKPDLLEERKMEIALSQDVVEKKHLARRNDLSKEIALILIDDKDVVVRMELANRTNLEEIWRRLSRDKSGKVREFARYNRYFGSKGII